MPEFEEPITDIVARHYPSDSNRGDEIALMRLYDELDDDGKQELLQMAIGLRRKMLNRAKLSAINANSEPASNGY